MSRYTSPTVTVFYVPENPNKNVTNLLVPDTPIFKFVTLSWTEPASPGTYNVYWEINGNWVNSGLSTTGNSIQIAPPRNATRLQLRTDNTYPSNPVDITFVPAPRQRTLTVTSRYDGVNLDWTPKTSSTERVQIYRNNVQIFFDNTLSYFHNAAGSYKVRFVKGTGSDTVVSAWSNTVTGSLLPAPPDRVEPTAPCDFYLGVNRAGEQIFHMCSPNVVPSAPPAVESGKSASDWFQDWVGINVDYGDNTYFHSMFDYIYCTKATRLRDYSDVSYGSVPNVRRFEFAGAQDIVTGATTTFSIPSGRMMMIVEVDKFGNRKLAPPSLVRELDITDTTRAVDVVYFGDSTGFGSAGAYYGPNTAFMRSNRSVRFIEIYEFNIVANGLQLEYENRAGVDNGIRLDENTFEVAGNSFDNMMLSYCGSAVDGSYVNSMNLSDAIIANKGSVDPLGIYNGPSGADTMQILGSTGGSGWDVTMETGIIKRGGKTWFNAGRGRNRIRFTGISDSDTTSSFKVIVPATDPANDGTNTTLYNATGVLTTESFLMSPSVVENSSVLAYSVVPTDDTGDSWVNVESAQKPIMGFSSFNERTLVYTLRKSAIEGHQLLPSGDPYWELHYTVELDVYIRKLSDSQFILEYDIGYMALYGSGGRENHFYIPGLSLSLLGLS